MPTITVLGALGAQGGSVVKSFVQDGTFTVRAVTRSVDSDAAKALLAKGVQVVAGDTKKPESLQEAFQGADAAFVVVNFWDPEIMMKELALTKQILDVAKKAGVEHILYASLANVEAVSNGKYDVPHFTMKAKAFDYAKNDLGFKYVTGIEAAFYYSNWFAFFKPTVEEDGTMVWKYPGRNKVSQFDPKTGTGPATLVAAKDPAKYNGKYILLEGDCLTPAESIGKIGKALGKKTRCDFIEPSVFATFFEGAHEFEQMVQWFDEYGYYGPETELRRHDSGRTVDPGLLTFDQWLATKEYENFM